MLTTRTLITLTLAALSAALPAIAAADAPAPAPAHIYVPGPPQYVGGPEVVEARFSPTGRFVFLVLTQPLDEEQQAARRKRQDWKPGVVQEPGISPLHVLLWSRRTGRTSVLWTSPWKETRFEQIAWLPNSETAMVTVSVRDLENERGVYGPSSRMHLIRLNPGSGRADERASVYYGPNSQMHVSPKLPTVVLISGGEEPSGALVVNDHGTGAPIELPEGVYSWLYQWSDDGATLYLPYHGDDYADTPEQPISWQAIDTRASTLRSVPNPPAGSIPVPSGSPPSPRTPFQFLTFSTPVRGGGLDFTAHPLWLDNGGGDRFTRFLLSTEGHAPRVSPAWDAVLYRSQGMAYLRSLRREARADYVGRREEALRVLAESHATAIGSALWYYAGSNDYNLPPADGLRRALEPDLAHPNVWDLGEGYGYGFVYIPSVEPVTPDKWISTVVGYFTAPGGRYEVRLGPAPTWQPDAK